MHRKWIKDWRKTIDSPIWTMPPLCYKVWKWILYRVDYHNGTIVTSMNQIADGVQWIERGAVRIPNRKTILSILDRLEAEKMIKKDSNRLYTTITVVNWDIYNLTNEEKVTVNGQLLGHSSRSIHENSKEVLQKISPFGDGQAAEPPPETDEIVSSQTLKKRKPKEPPDPLTDPNPFLHRVEAEHPKTVLVWRRDVGIIKTLLLGRKRGGVVDPQAEIWGCWTRFSLGEVDDTFKMRDRAHDIVAFADQYALLIERAGENGRAVPSPKKETVSEKMSRWAEKKDPEEAEREQKGI